MHYLLSIYFNNEPLHVSSRLTSSIPILPTASQHKHKHMTYTNLPNIQNNTS
jgi:hypothetical protein